MQFMLERTLQVPPDAPVKLLHDIESYSALVAMQSRMVGASEWYRKLS